MYSIGISYGSLIRSINNLSDSSGWNCTLLEIPLSKSTKIIRRMITPNSFSLHIPSLELIQEMPFLTDFANKNQVLTYIKKLSVLLEENRGAKYLVAHYPLSMSSSDPALIYSLNYIYIRELEKLCSQNNIKLYVENVAVNKIYYKPEIYNDILDYVSGICFDIGHAFSMDMVLFERNTDSQYVEDFFSLYRKNIKCIHLYNCTKLKNTPFSFGFHYPFGSVPNGYGFMNEKNIKKNPWNLVS